MKPVCWSTLIYDAAHIGELPREHLDAIARTAECESSSLTFGIAAIGELLAHTANAGELEDKTAASVAWLIHTLSELNARLTEARQAAEYQLTLTEPE